MTCLNASLRSRSNQNLQVSVFEERGKPEYPEKNLTENRREPNKKNKDYYKVVSCGWENTIDPLRASQVLGNVIYFFFKQVLY